MNLFRCLCVFGFLSMLTGCQTLDSDRLPAGGGDGPSRALLDAQIRNEKPGDYWIGRRYFKRDYRFWGYVRKPGQPWRSAQLIMMNEQRKFAPDREAGSIGSDNNYEYILHGYFSGDRVYEPPSNKVYPEFVLTGYKVISTNPPGIFMPKSIGSNPYSAVIEVPY